MTSIADAYVDLHVNGDNIEGEVRSEVKASERSVSRDFDKAGASLGEAMVAGFTKKFKFRNSTFLAKGRAAGSAVASGFTKGLSKIKDGTKVVGGELKEAFSGLSKLKFPAIAALVPLATSGISALSGALVAFTGAAVQASTATFSLVGVIGSLVQAKIVGGLAFKDFTKAVAGDKDVLKTYAPAARDTAKAVGELSGEWNHLRRAVQESVFKGLAADVTKVGKTVLPVLQNGFVQTGDILNTLFKRLGGFAQSEGFVKRFGKALSGNNAIFSNLSKAVLPLLRGILNLFIALQPSGVRLSKIFLNISKGFAAWANEKGRAEGINEFMRRAFKGAGLLLGIFKNLGGILRNVFGAATGPGKGLLKTFKDLTDRLKAFTELATTKNAIREWAKQGIEVSGKLFTGIGKGFMMIKGLFNPKILGGFMNVFEQIFPVIQSVVGVLQSALEPILKSIGETFAKNGPKFAALFEALKPLLKGVGAVIGQVISQSVDLLGTIASVITPVVKVISKVLGPILERFAPIIAGIILLFGGFGANLVKLVPIVGKFLAPMVKLSSWLLNKIGPAVGFLAKAFKIGFKIIEVVVGSTAKAAGGFVKLYFGTIFKIISFALKASVAVVKFAWKIISAVFTKYLGGVKLVVEKVLGGLKRTFGFIFDGIKFIVTNVWRGLKEQTAAIWGAIRTVVTKVVGGVKTAVTTGFNAIVGFVKKLPKKILGFAASFLNAGTELGNKIISGLWDGLKATGGFVSDLASSVKNAINDALHLPVTIKGPGPLPDFTIPAFAKGTNYAPGGVALVGERGPELVNLPRGSGVTNATTTREILREVNTDSGQRVYIGSMQPHDYGDFQKQMRDRRRMAALGGRRVSPA